MPKGRVSRASGVVVVLLVGVFLAAQAAAAGLRPAPTPSVGYLRDVRPILARRCFSCHGTDESHRMAGLRLDERISALARRGSKSPAIVPGAPERSPVIARVRTTDPARRMPPKGSGDALTAAEVRTLERWVRAGAGYEAHWAFVPPRAPALPQVKSGSWVRRPMDRFVLARLEATGLKPAPPADPYVLLRRVSLDLRGLPPTPEELMAFEQDRAPGAYERAVDRFLGDTAYGERWARVWLDLARYADSAGYGSDPLRPNMWRYRDWVIDAFNRNLPYDQFSIEQLAGDLLPNATLEQRMATAFHRNTMTNTEGGTDDEEFRTAAVRDRVDTTGQVWMGLTVGCAKCHSHKYDPVTNREYYQLFAIFNQSEDSDRGDEAPLLTVPTAEEAARLREAERQLAALRAELAANPARAPMLQKQIETVERSRPTPSTLPVMVERPPDKRRETHIQIKSNFLVKGEKVEAGVPAAFPPLPPGTEPNRLGLARWLVDRRNPLTARVAVNRFWAQIFGTGIVETEEDFGTQGEPPSHPELLDHLAVLFSSPTTGGGLGWDVKSLLRLIVTSATYRQSSAVTPAALAKDPRNRLFSRGPRFRLEAEQVRDQALALSGQLSRRIGGPSVYPPQPDGLWQAAFNGQRNWATSTGEDRYRRGIYTFWRRTVPYPSMTAFDAPSRETCSLRRIRTNTPLQAFVTLNDPVYVEAAQALGRRMVREGGTTPESIAAFGLRLCQCRPANPAQVRTLTALFAAERAHYASRPEEARKLATMPLGPLPAGAESADMAAWTVVANVLLNMDSVLTKG